MRSRVKMQLVFFLLAHFRTIWFILSILLKRWECLREELIMCNVFKIRVSKSLWKVRRSLLVLRSVSEGQMCSLCRWDTFLSGPRSSQVFWYLQQLSVISSLLSGRDVSSLDRALGRRAWSPYHTTNNTPLHHKICDGKRENSPSPKYRTPDTDRELTTG